jgi:hypothetical protein
MLDFYTRYPMMAPHVGDNYHRRTSPSLLLVGESHYLPHGASQHLKPTDWYGGDRQTLKPEEARWLDTAGILANACKQGFPRKAHWIWKNAFEVINAAGPQYADARQVANDIAFVNFFLRPAPEKGGSLAGHLTPQDIDIANAAFAMHLEQLAPTAVVFVSRLARRNFRPAASFAIPVISTPHPTSHWWNRVSPRYGGKRGRDVLADYVASLDWSGTRAGA